MNENKPSIWKVLYRYKMHHVLLWIVYYVFWISLYLNYYELPKLVLNVTVYFIFQATGFYATAYYLFPRFLNRQKFVTFFILFGMLTIGLALVQAYFLYLSVPVRTEYTTYFSLTKFSFMGIVMMVGLLSAAKLIFEKIRTERANRLRDKQRLESELQFLKAQVNPHFLFNAINSIYFLIKKNPDQAAETLIKLSDLLRFQLYDCSDEKIAIEKELGYLHNFIALEKIRKGEKIKVHIEQHGNLSGFELSPFLLMPFVENAFKHVSTGEKENVISIILERENNTLTARIENTTEKKVAQVVGGIGLQNVRRRLELLYPGSHKLDIDENDSEYAVHLSLTIS
jgi:two-component system LytT family sensor kinase